MPLESLLQIVNGNVTSTSSITFTYILMANNAGEYTIPGASIIADGDQMVANSVKIKVLPQDQGGNSGQNNSSSGSIHSSSGTSVSNQDLFIMGGTQALKPYSVGAGNGTGSGLLFCLMPVLNEDDEFRQKFQEFVVTIWKRSVALRFIVNR